jgi:osmotically inducible protein OsmC
MKNTATANWKGPGATGTGSLNTKSNALRNAQYTYKTRFEGAEGTNPEELIAAAHAGCFAMKLAFTLDKAGFKPEEIDAVCENTFEGGAVTASHIEVKVKVKDIEKSKFDELVADAGKNCPISKLLNTAITVNGTLA